MDITLIQEEARRIRTATRRMKYTRHEIVVKMRSKLLEKLLGITLPCIRIVKCVRIIGGITWNNLTVHTYCDVCTPPEKLRISWVPTVDVYIPTRKPHESFVILLNFGIGPKCIIMVIYGATQANKIQTRLRHARRRSRGTT